MSRYGSPYARTCLDTLADMFPDARLLDPSTIFASDAEWRRAWPRLVRVLGGLVMFGAEDGTIGAGCIGEMADAIAVGVPIAGFELGRGLREIRGYDVIDPRTRTPRRAAVLRLGHSVDREAWGRGIVGGDNPMRGTTTALRPSDRMACPILPVSISTIGVVPTEVNQQPPDQ